MFTIPLKKLSIKESHIAGSKASVLGKIYQKGFKVPSGFVIPAYVFDTFLNYYELSSNIFSLLESTDYNNEKDLKIKSKRIRNSILSRKIPKDIEKAILLEFKKIKSKRIIVRPSALVEDGIKISWAGQFESFQNTTEKELILNIKKSWASVFSEKALRYRYSKKFIKKPISVAIIVQKEISSKVSGVAFSRNPTTNENTIIIEAGLGLGESLVSGQITPDKYFFNKEREVLFDANIQTQLKKIDYIKNKKTWIKLPEKEGSQQFLSQKDIFLLSKKIIELEKIFNYPIDVEWVKEKGKGNIYIVQVRPITKIQKQKKNLKTHKKIFHKPILAFSAMECWNKGEDKNSDLLFIYKPNKGTEIYYKKDSIKSNPIEMLIFYLENKEKLEALIRETLQTSRELENLLKNKQSNNIKKMFELLIILWPKITNLYILLLAVEKNIFIPKKILSKINQTRIRSEKISHLTFDFILNHTENYLTNKKDDFFYFSDFLSLEEILKEKYKREKPNLFKKIGKKKGFVYYQRKIYLGKEMSKLIRQKIEKEEEIQGNKILGEPIVSNKVKGTAKIILDFTKIKDSHNKFILITSSISPEFSKITKNILGIVTEEGGSLSHAAILAREFNIPCIIGVKGITTKIKNGQKIEINKKPGLVEILKDIKKI